MPTTQYPSMEQLKRALEIARKIEALESELAGVLDVKSGPLSASKAKSQSKAAAPLKGVRQRRTMSPEGREKIAAAQRNRWMKVKGGNGSSTTAAVRNSLTRPIRAKRIVSPESRAKMAESARIRWAKAGASA